MNKSVTDLKSDLLNEGPVSWSGPNESVTWNERMVVERIRVKSKGLNDSNADLLNKRGQNLAWTSVKSQ